MEIAVPARLQLLLLRRQMQSGHVGAKGHVHVDAGLDQPLGGHAPAVPRGEVERRLVLPARVPHLELVDVAGAVVDEPQRLRECTRVYVALT